MRFAAGAASLERGSDCPSVVESNGRQSDGHLHSRLVIQGKEAIVNYLKNAFR
jgi:hypothetical protein